MAATKADIINCSMGWVIARDSNYCCGRAEGGRRRGAYKEKAWKENKDMGKETKSGIRTSLLFKGEENPN